MKRTHKRKANSRRYRKRKRAKARHSVTPKVFPAVREQMNMRELFKEAGLQDPEQAYYTLTKWLAEAQEDGELPHHEQIFRASKDGWTAEKFHEHCDNKGKTLTVILSSGFGTDEVSVFGGYADASWNSSNRFIASPGNAFLFALQCWADMPPTKMPLTGSKNGQAMSGRRDCGPSFGGGFEIHLGSQLGKTWHDGSYTDIGKKNVYKCPKFKTTGYDHMVPCDAILVGVASRFIVSEVVVYRVETGGERRTRLAAGATAVRAQKKKKRSKQKKKKSTQ
jgi:hypothetical protein